MPKISSYPQIGSIDDADLFVVSDDSSDDATKSITVEQITTFIRQGRNILSNNTDPASASNVGSLRYREQGNNSYIDLAMRTGASSYAWINIVQNNW